MTDAKGFDFTQFVPGFDFLKKLGSGGGAASAATPAWVAPTLDPAELDRRIQELKTVHFWLDQNTKAVSATIQALEVQRMTLNALQGMNVSLSEMADSLKIKPETFATPSFASPGAEATPASAFAAATEAPAPGTPKPAAQPKAKKKRAAAKPEAEAEAAATAQVDPGQWWGALTQQFQNIAQTAMSEMSKNAATHPGAPVAAKPAATAPRPAARASASGKPARAQRQTKTPRPRA